MKLRLKPVLLFFSLMCILIWVLICRRVNRPTSQLMERSQKVVSVFEWSGAYPDTQNNLPGEIYYFWLNEKELLHFRHQAGGLQGVRSNVGDTASETEIPGLLIPENSVPMEVSSNGKRLFWLKATGDQRHIHPRISVLDNSEYAFTYPVVYTLPLYPPRIQFRIDATDPSDHYKIVTQDSANMKYYSAYHNSAPFRFAIGEETPFEPSGRLFSEEQLTRWGTGLEIATAVNEFRVDYKIHPWSKPLIEHTIQIGKDRGVENVCLSPNGERIFFEERSGVKDTMPGWIHNLISPPRSQAKEKRTFTIVDVKTGKRKELASYEVPAPLRGHQLPCYVHDVKWTPDGKRLSYIYNQNLYTISAE